MTELYIMDGPDKGQSFDIVNETTLIGRSSSNDIRLKDKFVSRTHLKIIARENRFFVIREIDNTVGYHNIN